MTTDLEAPVEAIEPAEVVTVPSVFGPLKPYDVLKQAWALSVPLCRMIGKRGLSVKIRNREFVKVEGWTALGAMCGVFPIVEWTRPITTKGYGPSGEEIQVPHGWEAAVEARTLGGALVGRAEAQCTRDENMWAQRDDYALRAMAQTRATSRAMRGPLGFIMALGGYEATAAEEMPRED